LSQRLAPLILAISFSERVASDKSLRRCTSHEDGHRCAATLRELPADKYKEWKTLDLVVMPLAVRD
jgi:hypothetical protein